MKIASSILIGLAGLALQIQRANAQGTLAPPGPPGPTMLTLSQVQPRTPVDAVHTPSNGANEFAIINSGSYYLTTNIVGLSGKDGIDIYTNNVTLDLNGFSLSGPSGSIVGIQIVAGTNVTVLNGAISGWGIHGIYNAGNNATLEHLSVSDNSTFGIVLDNLGTVRYCTTSANKFTGIAVIASGCVVADNVCSSDNWGNNSADGGIAVLGNYNRIENNHVTGAGIGGFGIGVPTYNNSTNNIIIRNSVEGNGLNDYVFNSMQVVGPIITNAISGIITNSNPWANFGF